MKIKYSVCVLLALGSMVSCKIDKKEKPKAIEAIETPANVNSKVKVTLEMIVPNDDNFQLFYNENGTMDYNGDLAVKVPVKGQPGIQVIEMPLKEEALPTTIRLDLGENQAQGKMTINKVTITFFDKSLEIKGAEFFKYFTINENFEADKVAATLTPKVVNNSYDPMSYPTDELINALKPIVLGK